jgi:hypothetical protein
LALAICSVAADANAPAVVFTISAITAEDVALRSSVAVRLAVGCPFHPVVGKYV